jgi:DNA-binding Lrp family transcriptional regulator
MGLIADAADGASAVLVNESAPRHACTHSHRCIENRSDACKIRAAAQSGGTTVPEWRGCFALFCMLGSASSVHAQRPDDFRRTFLPVAQSAPVYAVQAQLERWNRDPVGAQKPAYAVSGIILGTTVQVDSRAFKDYKCTPSDQFDGFTWCQKTQQEKERRGKFSSTYSILHSPGGVTVYIDRYLEPAFFGAKEADDDIRQYSRSIGETPRITRMPQRDGVPNGILASWGKVELDPLDADSIKALAMGRRATSQGYLVDFIGDFARSATSGLPIYRIGGGAGFLWVASFDQRGLGTLRLTAVDASALPPITAPRIPIEAAANAGAQSGAVEDSRDQAEIDAGPARKDADKARDEALIAEINIGKAAAEERPRVDAVFAQLEADKTAAEAEGHAMELVAYGGIISLVVLVIVVAPTRIQKTQTARPRRRPNSLKRHHLYQTR